MTEQTPPTLEAVRDWYVAVRHAAKLLSRLGEKHWDNLPDDHPISRDELFKRYTTGAKLGTAAEATATDVLEDTAVLMLFAAFEGRLRARAAGDVKAELAALPPQSLLSRVPAQLGRRVERAALARLLDFYSPSDPRLVDEVKALRLHRNSLVHGRSVSSRKRLRPENVYTVLSRFLSLLESRSVAEPAGGPRAGPGG